MSILRHLINQFSALLLSQVLPLQEARSSPLHQALPTAIMAYPRCRASNRLLTPLEQVLYTLYLYSFLRIRRTLTTYYDVAAFLLHCILRANGHLILRRSLFHEIVFIIYLCFLASILIFQQQVKVSIPHHPVNKLSSLLSEVLLLQETRLSPLRRDQPMAIIKFPHCKAAGRLPVQLV